MLKRNLVVIGSFIFGGLLALNSLITSGKGLLRFTAKGEFAYGSGFTDDRSVQMTRRFLDKHPDVQTLVLKNVPGTRDIVMNDRVARLIRARGLDTLLEPDSHIASGGVSLFLAGKTRTIQCGAKIGVHSWGMGRNFGDDFRPERLNSDPLQKSQEQFLIDMGLDPAFYAFTRDAAKPSEIHYMSWAEIRRFGLMTEPNTC